MNRDKLEKLLTDVQTGSLGIEEALSYLRNWPTEELPYAKIDHHRGLRCGFPEVIFGIGKTDFQIVELFEKMALKEENVLATKVSHSTFSLLQERGVVPEAKYDELGKVLYLQKTQPASANSFIAIVTAGTADFPVAIEAQKTVELMNYPARLFGDVGVAGIHRLLRDLPEIQKASVIIVVAGMEGALPSVVAGLVDCPVIAVPTSVGYGSSLVGFTALFAMLNSCVPGITVVNIDNGFGAGCAAGLIHRTFEMHKKS